jgi:hypothetical protein
MGKIRHANIDFVGLHLLLVNVYVCDLLHQCFQFFRYSFTLRNILIFEVKICEKLFVSYVFYSFNEKVFFRSFFEFVFVSPEITTFFLKNFLKQFYCFFLLGERGILKLAYIPYSSPSSENHEDISIGFMKYLHTIEHILSVLTKLNINFCHQKVVRFALFIIKYLHTVLLSGISVWLYAIVFFNSFFFSLFY